MRVSPGIGLLLVLVFPACAINPASVAQREIHADLGIELTDLDSFNKVEERTIEFEQGNSIRETEFLVSLAPEACRLLARYREAERADLTLRLANLLELAGRTVPPNIAWHRVSIRSHAEVFSVEYQMDDMNCLLYVKLNRNLDLR